MVFIKGAGNILKRSLIVTAPVKNSGEDDSTEIEVTDAPATWATVCTISYQAHREVLVTRLWSIKALCA